MQLFNLLKYKIPTGLNILKKLFLLLLIPLILIFSLITRSFTILILILINAGNNFGSELK